jgi:hypothetical protein
MQQVMDALKDTRVESHKVRKYLPDFLERLREDLVKELRGQQGHQSDDHEHPSNQGPSPATNNSVLFTHQSFSQPPSHFQFTHRARSVSLRAGVEVGYGEAWKSHASPLLF